MDSISSRLEGETPALALRRLAFGRLAQTRTLVPRPDLEHLARRPPVPPALGISSRGLSHLGDVVYALLSCIGDSQWWWGPYTGSPPTWLSAPDALGRSCRPGYLRITSPMLFARSLYTRRTQKRCNTAVYVCSGIGARCIPSSLAPSLLHWDYGGL